MALPHGFALSHQRETLDEPPLVILTISPALCFRLTTGQARELYAALKDEIERARGFDPKTGRKTAH
jgi:hypothetical protein